MTIEVKSCPAGKTVCDTNSTSPCVFSKEGLCDYPYRAISQEPMTPVHCAELCRQYGVSDFSHTFASFQCFPENKDVFDAFVAFVKNPYARPLLVCYGGTGNGKTHLLEAMAIELAFTGRRVRIQQFVDVLDGLKSALRNKDKPWLYEEIVHAYCKKIWCICWDDVGMGTKWTDWEVSFLEQVVISRFRDRLPTVLVSNLDILSLPERVVSRARDKSQSRLVFNSAKDFRPLKNL